MVTIEYEQSLIETTVFLAVRSDDRLECELHEVVDRLYEIPDEEVRQREFVPVFREFFTTLGFDKLMTGLLAERPLIGQLVDRCVVREAPRKKAQSAELLVQDKRAGDDCVGRTLVIQICPQSFLDTRGTAAPNPLRALLVALLRRELLHVADMLDERFGYVREVFSGDPSQQNLHRDRYRVLWDAYVAGRLEREQFGMKAERGRLERSFARVFTNTDAGTHGGVFAAVFDAPALTHREFMDWSSEPSLLADFAQVSTQVAVGTA